MKFLITNSVGEQHVLETDKGYSQLVAEFPPTTDIQPISEAPVEVGEEVVESKSVKKRKTAQKEEGDK